MKIKVGKTYKYKNTLWPSGLRIQELNDDPILCNGVNLYNLTLEDSDPPHVVAIEIYLPNNTYHKTLYAGSFIEIDNIFQKIKTFYGV